MRYLLLSLILLSACSSHGSPAKPAPYVQPALATNPTSYGGIPNDGLDDTAAIQDAIDNSDGQVDIEEGVWNVDAQTRLNIPSNRHLNLAHGAVLQSSNHGSANGFLLWLVDVSHVRVTGGIIRGDRSVTGLGIGMFCASSSDIQIIGTRFEDFETDGLVVTQSTSGIGRRIVIDRCDFVNNGRNGASICHADSVTITNCHFTGSNEHSPMSGLDLEPDHDLSVTNVFIANCEADHNSGRGFLLQRGMGDACSFINVVSCIAHDNGTSGFELSNVTDAVLTTCISTANGTHGFNYNGTPQRLTFNGCHSTSNTSCGLIGSFGTTIGIAGCIFTSNGVHGVAIEANDLRITGTSMSANGYYGLWLTDGDGIVIQSNTLQGNAVDNLVDGSTGTAKSITGNVITP